MNQMATCAPTWLLEAIDKRHTVIYRTDFHWRVVEPHALVRTRGNRVVVLCREANDSRGRAAAPGEWRFLGFGVLEENDRRRPFEAGRPFPRDFESEIAEVLRKA